MSKLLPTMADVAREAGVSLVTVDRVLNRRGVVKAATEQKVLDAAQRLNFALGKVQLLRDSQPPVALQAAARTRKLVFFLLRSNDDFYRSLAQAMDQQSSHHPEVLQHQVYFLDGLDPAQCASLLLEKGGGADAIALVSVDHPQINQAVDKLSHNGTRVFAFITDITASQRAGYVGIDNRKAGRTAAWAISRLSKRPGKVGVLLGDHRFLCQELCEISFRSYFREQAGGFELVDTRLTLESAERGEQVTGELLELYPDLVGLYVSCGGEEGVIRALQASGRQRDIVVVTHDLIESTRHALVEGVVDLSISVPVNESVNSLISMMVNTSFEVPSIQPRGAESLLVSFDIETVENI